MAETINGLYKAEVIHRRGPWRSFEAVEYATLEWAIGSTIAGCWSPSATSRLPKPKINIILPRIKSIWQRDSQPNASGRPGAVQIDLTPGAKRGEVNAMLYGEFGRILEWIEQRRLAENAQSPDAKAPGLCAFSVSVVAGAGFEPATFRL